MNISMSLSDNWRIRPTSVLTFSVCSSLYPLTPVTVSPGTGIGSWTRFTASSGTGFCFAVLAIYFPLLVLTLIDDICRDTELFPRLCCQLAVVDGDFEIIQRADRDSPIYRVDDLLPVVFRVVVLCPEPRAFRALPHLKPISHYFPFPPFGFFVPFRIPLFGFRVTPCLRGPSRCR